MKRKRRDDDEVEDEVDDDERDSDDEDDERDRRRSKKTANLKSIAGFQKGIMFCILGYLAAVVAFYFMPPKLMIVLYCVAVVVGLTSAVLIFLLSLEVYSSAAGIVLGILTLVPVIGLIVLLIVSGKATSILKEHGIRVGLLGANSSDLRKRTRKRRRDE